MSSRFFLIFLIAVLQIFSAPPRLFATINEQTEDISAISQRYDEAKFYYNQLQTNSTLAASRENWLKGTRNFRRIYLSSPKSDPAAACLFMLGRVYGDMFDRFQETSDLDESISYFHDTARLFPQHRLADDAYFALAQLYLDKQNNPQKAAESLTAIVNDYPAGDMRPMAEDLLKILSKEHNIPLPKVMVSSSGENNLSYVLPVKYWSSDNYTRVVIMASSPVNYKEVLLEETENQPRRLYIDFNKSYIEPQYRSPVPIEDGLLRQIRTGQFSPDTVRVVLDMQSIGDYKIFSLPDPFRVVIDVRGETGQAVEHSSQPITIVSTKTKIHKHVATDNEPQGVAAQPAEPQVIVLRESNKVAYSPAADQQDKKVESDAGSPPLSLAQQLGLGVKKIVLDPGHGGRLWPSV